MFQACVNGVQTALNTENYEQVKLVWQSCFVMTIKENRPSVCGMVLFVFYSLFFHGLSYEINIETIASMDLSIKPLNERFSLYFIKSIHR